MHHALTRPRTELEVASPFYEHPYGGIARDVLCTREGFARFFEVSLSEVDSMDVNCKWFDVMTSWNECLGYKLLRKRGGTPQYRITIIERGHSRVGFLLSIAPHLWSEFIPCHAN